jgi:archaellum biogenesis protein FlaJ (TadC family)
MVTMKDGKINVEEKPELSELLSQAMNEDKEEKSYLNESMKEAIKTHGEFMKRKKERAMELPEGFYKNDKNSEFFTSSLETMKDIITDEVKRDKILQRISEGAKFGTFRRYKTQQPMLVKAYKTRKGADQNTFWRNR